MLYDDIAIYDADSVSYDGVLVLNISGITAPLVINDVTIVFVGKEDYSNYTTLGTITYDLAPTGVMTIDCVDNQLEGILNTDIIYISESGELLVQKIDNQPSAEINIVSDEKAAAVVRVINISDMGSISID